MDRTLHNAPKVLHWLACVQLDYYPKIPENKPLYNLREAVPEEHLELLRGLEKSFTIGDYFFAHAGAAPGVALADQTAEDLMWIRGPFLNSRKAFEKVVVHGHSASPTVTIAEHRIGLDTGAGTGGKLTCAVLEDDLVGLIAA